MIKTALKILLVEDYEIDADLITMQIHKIVENPEIKVVDNVEDCNNKLHNFVPDVVISDYNLPTCTGLDILKLVKKFDENLAFIFVTGTIDDDELAANTILSGASGFISITPEVKYAPKSRDSSAIVFSNCRSVTCSTKTSSLQPA